MILMLPQLSLSMEEGKIARWLVADGDQVRVGQPIVEIESDKATLEVEAPTSGTIRLLENEGRSVPVNGMLAEIVEAAGEPTLTIGSPSPGAPGAPNDRKHRISPAARRIARERGIDLRDARGSSPAGRIRVADLDTMQSAPSPSLREAVLTNVTASWRQIPHIHIGGELDGSGLAAAKRTAAEGVTVTDLLLLTLVRALRAAPELNGTIGKISPHVHLALAVETPNGVVAPVIRNAEALSLNEISRTRARLVADARAGAPEPRDLAGGTITLSNLGTYPVDFFAPIISGPQIAIVATGRLTERPVATDGVVVIRHRIWTNIAIDHRGADGASGGRFLSAFQRCLDDLPS